MKEYSSLGKLEETSASDFEFTFSPNCGSIISVAENIFSIKPICFNYQVEISPLNLHKYMLLDSERTHIHNRNQKISLPMDYKHKRCELIALIQRKTSMYKYKLKTFYLALYILDNIYLNYNYENLESEGVALVSLLLAVKFEEDDAFIPDLNEFGFINYKNFYTIEDLRNYEVRCLLILNYNIKIHSPFNYLYSICLNGFLFNDECFFDENNKIILHSNTLENLCINNRLFGLDKLYRLCFDILEIVNLDLNYLNFSAFIIACAIVSLVRELYGFNKWSNRLESIYKLKFDKDLINSYNFVKSVFLNATEIKSNDCIISTSCIINDAKEEKKNVKKLIQEKEIKKSKDKPSSIKKKNSSKLESKSINRFNKELIYKNNNNLSKNILILQPSSKINHNYIKNFKNNLKSIDIVKSVDDSCNNKTCIKPLKKLKYFSQFINEKGGNKNNLSIKTNVITFSNAKPNSVCKDNVTSRNSKNTSLKSKASVLNPKREVKSQLFKENFKSYKEKSSGKSITKDIRNIGKNNKFNSNSIEKFTIDTATVLNSTKSNSFASSFSNNNTFSNSLKHLNLVSQFSSNNTVESTMSNNSFVQTKDLKTKFSIINLDKTKTASTCNVVISLNTNRVKNKKFVSSFFGHEPKKSEVEAKNKNLSKKFKKK